MAEPDEVLYGQRGVEAEQGYQRMPELPDPNETDDSAEKPLQELMAERQAEAEADPEIERPYVYLAGEQAGERLPENQTVSH